MRIARVPAPLPLITALLICALLASLLPTPVLAQEQPTDVPLSVSVESPTAEPSTVAPLEADLPSEDIDPLPDLSSWTKSVQLHVTQDAYVSSGNPNANHGGLPYLNMGYQSGEQAVRPVLQFDLGGIPSKSRIVNASMHLYQYQVIPPGDPSTRVDGRKMVAPWSEHSITWNNARYDGSAANMGSVSSSIGWQGLDIKSILQSWVNGQGNYGVILTGNETAPVHLRSFRSREGGNGPYIDVQYICDTKSPASNVTHPLPQYSKATFQVTWSGEDRAPENCTPSGIQYFEVEYRVNSSATWHKVGKGKYPPQQMSDTFTYSQDGDLITFRWRGVDNVGNKEDWGHAETHTTVDSQPPTTSMTSLPPITTATSFTIHWTGTDPVSGVANYDVEYRMLIPGSSMDWIPLLTSTTETSFNFTGAIEGATYEFRTRARDHAGNQGHYPDFPQATTVIDVNPHATVNQFVPPILKPTAPVTDTFTVHWTGYAVDGAAITEYQIYYKYESQPWQEWNVFPAGTTSAPFPYLSMGMGDGIYQFEATATDSAGHTKPRTGVAEAVMIVDLADLIQPAAYMPVVAR